MLPTVVVHADWSLSPDKRWLAVARRTPDGHWRVEAPQPVGDPRALLHAPAQEAGAGGCALAGFDLPIGIPAGYAAHARVETFLDLLPRLGTGAWSAFFDVAEKPEQIGSTQA